MEEGWRIKAGGVQRRVEDEFSRGRGAMKEGCGEVTGGYKRGVGTVEEKRREGGQVVGGKS